MTAPALPPEVERAIGQFAYAVRREAQEPGEPSTTYATEQAAALRTAIARALGGDGEPVAWQIVDVKDGPTAYIGVTEDAAWARMEKATGWNRVSWGDSRHARPLYTRPAATGDTGEVEKAAVDALRWWFDRCGDPVDRETFKRECQRKFAAVLAMHDAATTRAATGGPDAR